MKKHTGYRLHFEGNDTEPTAHHDMASVRAEIREQAKEAGVTIARATKYVYIVTEEEYQEALELDKE